MQMVIVAELMSFFVNFSDWIVILMTLFGVDSNDTKSFDCFDNFLYYLNYIALDFYQRSEIVYFVKNLLPCYCLLGYYLL